MDRRRKPKKLDREPTGSLPDAALDKVSGGLSTFASANGGNPAVIGAVETTSTDIKAK